MAYRYAAPAAPDDGRRKVAFALIASAIAAFVASFAQGLRTSAPIAVVVALVPLAASAVGLALVVRDSDVRRYALGAAASFGFAIAFGLASFVVAKTAFAPHSLLAGESAGSQANEFTPPALVLLGFTATRAAGVALLALSASGIRATNGDELGVRIRLAIALAVATAAGALLFAAAPATFSGWAASSFRGTLGASSFGGFVDAYAVRLRFDAVDDVFMAAPLILLGAALLPRAIASLRPAPPAVELPEVHRIARARIAAVAACLVSLALFGVVVECAALLSERTSSAIQGFLTHVQAAVVTSIAMVFATMRREESRSFRAFAILGIAGATVLAGVFLADVWIALGREKEGLSIFVSPLAVHKTPRVLVLALWFVACAGSAIACALAGRSTLVRGVTARLATNLWVSAIAGAICVVTSFAALASSSRSSYGLFASVAALAALVTIVAAVLLGRRARHLT